MKKHAITNKKLTLRSLTLRHLAAVGGGYVAGAFPRETAAPSVCPVSCTTREPEGCATGDNCVIKIG